MSTTLVDWQKLESDRLEALIRAVRSSSESQLFSAAHSEAASAQLPFYNSFRLYRLSNFSSLPIFTTEYLSDGTSWYYLDGTPETILEVNKTDGMRLTPRTVIDYLAFYFDHVVMEEGEILTYEKRGYGAPPQAQGVQLPPPTIDFSPETRAYTIHMPLYVDGTLMHGGVGVGPEGRVSLESLRPFLTDAASAFNSVQSLGIPT